MSTVKRGRSKTWRVLFDIFLCAEQNQSINQPINGLLIATLRK